MSPADIAKEIKQFSFFAFFDDAFLDQVSHSLRLTSFDHGDVILSAGDTNDKLFLLRTGEVEILVEGERIRILKNPGESIGEMSAFSRKYTSATVRALTNCEFFVLKMADFHSIESSKKEHLELLIYKVYSAVLSDRLVQMSDKAKLFEKTARDLEKTKRDLETITATQMHFLLSEAKKALNRKQVLFIDNNKKNQLVAKKVLGGTGVNLDLADGFNVTNEFLNKTNYDLIFCSNELSCQFSSVDSRYVLVSSVGIDLDSLEAQKGISNFITWDTTNRASSSKILLTTLTKLLQNDLFGIEKYLSWGVDVIWHEVTKSSDREPLREEMMAHFKSRGIRNSLLDRAQVSAEELLMNSIYDAPVDSDGNHVYNHLSRSVPIALVPSQFATFRYATDGIYLAISVEDPFGSLSRTTLLKYIKSCYSGAPGSLNKDKGGAGRGLHLIIESSDITVFNVKAKQRTEVICLWNIEDAANKTENHSTLHFFFS